MAVLNPPWQTDEHIRLLLAELWPILSPEQQGSYRLEWLKKAD
jgi:23S rRNA A2030 N6-methylase RlmJ